MVNALVRARIPYLPVHADHIERDGPRLSVLILPNLAAMSESQCQAVRQFVERGGSLIATGQTSLYDRWGEPRADFALADLFGAHVDRRPRQLDRSRPETGRRNRRTATSGSRPSCGQKSMARRSAPNLRSPDSRHPILAGFDETDILPFGGWLGGIQAAAGAEVLATFIPSFPIYPPETSWMRQPRTNIPGLIVSTAKQGSRIAYLPADLDRRFARDNLPDHGDLLGQSRPMGLGRVDSLDRRRSRGSSIAISTGRRTRLILHLVNLTSAGTGRAPVHELIRIGPLRVRVQIPQGIRMSRMKCLVSQQTPAFTRDKDAAVFQLPSLLDHEVIVLE